MSKVVIFPVLIKAKGYVSAAPVVACGFLYFVAETTQRAHRAVNAYILDKTFRDHKTKYTFVHLSPFHLKPQSAVPMAVEKLESFGIKNLMPSFS